MPDNDLDPNIIEDDTSVVNTGQPRRDFINIVPEMSEELKSAINYLNEHRFDNYGAVDYGDEDDASVFDFSNDTVDSSDVNSVNSTIVEDDSSTESFDDIGLF